MRSASQAPALTLALLLGLSHEVSAAPASLRTSAGEYLLWQAPAGCASAESVHGRVRELLGESALDLKQVRRVEGRVTRRARGFWLDLTLVDASGKRERRLGADSCEDLAEAAAVAITLAFDAARAAEAREEPEPAALEAEPLKPEPLKPEPLQPEPLQPEPLQPEPLQPEPSGATEGSPTSPTPPTPTPSDAATGGDAATGDAATETAAPRAGARLGLGLELVVDVSSLPVAAAGGSLLAELRWSELAVGAYGLWLPGAEESLGPGQSVGFDLLGGGLRTCYRLGQGLIETQLCGGIEAGRLSARATGLLRAQAVSDLWLAPHAGLELRVELARAVALHVRGDAVAPLLRQDYAVNETESVHHIAALGVRAAVGVLLAL